MRSRSPLLVDLAFAGAVALVAILAILPGSTGAGRSISTMQLVASIAAMVVAAVGLNLLMGYTRLVSLGQGAFYAIGAYGSAYLTRDVGLPPLLAILCALLLCALVGAAAALATMRMHGPQFAVITLVLAVLVERILSEGPAFGRLAGYPNFAQHGATVLDPITIFGIALYPPAIAGEVATVMVPIMLVTGLVVIMSRNIINSPWGASLTAIGAGDMLASHLGINVFARKVAVFVLAAILGGIGGVIYTQAFAHLQPETFDIFLTIIIVLAVVLGGGGTVLGPVLGAVVIIWLEQSQLLAGISDWQRETLSEKWYLSPPGLVGVLFLVTLFALPRGIVGTLERRVATRRGARERAADTGGLRAAKTAAEASTASPAPAPREASGTMLLQARGLSKTFGGLQAVSDMDIDVAPGSIHAIIGPNGAGKSTLANLLTGVYRASAGTVQFGGADITGRRPHEISRAGVARSFQTPQLFHDATVRTNVLAGFTDTGQLPLWRAAIKPPSRYRRDAELAAGVDGLLELVGLTELGDVLADELPYGQQRAVEIARALAGNPRLIVLDEPAAGLLATETLGLGDLLMKLRSEGYALIVVEHHMDLVARIADTVTCMDQGSLLARGSAADVLADEAVVSAYLGRRRRAGAKP